MQEGPRRSQRPLHAVIVGALVALALALHAGCSNQREGERCDNGDAFKTTQQGLDECVDGLVCTSRSLLGQTSDRCCPPDLANATTTICRQPASAGDGAAPLADTGTPDGPAPTTDAGKSDAGSSDAGSSDAAAIVDAPLGS